MRIFGSSYHDLCKKGWDALSSGDLETANKLSLKAIKLDKTHPRAFSLLGWCYQEAGDRCWRVGNEIEYREYLDLAIKAFDDAIRRETDAELTAQFWWQKGSCLRGLGRDDTESLREADKAVPGFCAKQKQEAENAFKEAAEELAKEPKPR